MLLITNDAELLPSVGEVTHDKQTVKLYGAEVRCNCTCGNHAPPPGLADRPEAHIPGCGYRAHKAKRVNQYVLVGA